jgi:hypothetical protein
MDGEYIENQGQQSNQKRKKNEVDLKESNRVSCFKGDDSEPELE